MIVLEELHELERELDLDRDTLARSMREAIERGHQLKRVCEGRLGEILVGAGVLTQQDLERALAEQKAHPHWLPLGKVLIRMGLVSTFKVYRVLGKQYGVDPEHFKDVRRMGEILVDDGVITRSQLEEALELQRTERKGEPLGRILVSLGHARLHDVYEALCDQLAHIVHHLIRGE